MDDAAIKMAKNKKSTPNSVVNIHDPTSFLFLDKSQSAAMRTAMSRFSRTRDRNALLDLYDGSIPLHGILRSKSTPRSHPIFLAINVGDQDAVKALVEIGVSVLLPSRRPDKDPEGNTNFTPLSWCAQHGHKELTKWMLDKVLKGDPDEFESFVYLREILGHHALITYLDFAVDRGLRLDCCGEAGQSVLYDLLDQKKLFRELDAQDQHEQHLGSLLHAIDRYKLSAKSGPTNSILLKSAEAFFDIAQKLPASIKPFLERQIFDAKCVDSQGNGLFHALAVSQQMMSSLLRDSWDAFEALRLSGFNPSLPNNEGHSALDLAISKGNMGCVSMLMAMDATCSSNSLPLGPPWPVDSAEAAYRIGLDELLIQHLLKLPDYDERVARLQEIANNNMNGELEFSENLVDWIAVAYDLNPIMSRLRS